MAHTKSIVIKHTDISLNDFKSTYFYNTAYRST